MMSQAKQHGVEVMDCRVTNMEDVADGVVVYGENGTLKADVVVGAFGLDLGTAAVFNQWNRYQRPPAMETVITNIPVEADAMERLHDEILAFLPRIPGVSFGAITPKRDHLTVNVAGSHVTAETMKTFLSLQEVRRWFPAEVDTDRVAERCYKGHFPNRPAKHFYGDRFVAIGDAAGMVRPFKGKGVTAACMTGIAAAKAMMDFGISRKAFLAYEVACQEILSDRFYGWTAQRIADFLRTTGTLDSLIRVAQRDAGLRHSLFLSVSGDEPYRKILRTGLQVSRATRIAREMVLHRVFSWG